MPDFPFTREWTRQDAPGFDGGEDQAGAENLAIPDVIYVPPSARRVTVTSLQHWLDLCA
jgi:hypothetical protein